MHPHRLGALVHHERTMLRLITKLAILPINMHSSYILAIQQGLSWGVSSIGNPQGPLAGLNLGSMGEELSSD